jgi:hypothetical protein
MPNIGSETYRSSVPPEATKETAVSKSHVPPDVEQGPDWETIPPGAAPTPTLEFIAPATLNVPGPDAELVLVGAGFTSTSIIVWNNGDEATEFVSNAELRTIIKPSTVEATLPFTLPVYVRNGSIRSNSVDFTFTEGEVVETKEPKVQPHEKEPKKEPREKEHHEKHGKAHHHGKSGK